MANKTERQTEALKIIHHAAVMAVKNWQEIMTIWGII